METLPWIKPLVFYTFSALAVGSAITVIVLRNPLYSAVTLVLTFFSLAGIFVLLDSETIAVFQVLVYTGAIMVLVIFVIMLLNLRKLYYKIERSHLARSAVAIILSVVLFFAITSLFTGDIKSEMANATKGEITSAAVQTEGGFKLFSRSLFSEYLLPFELVSLLLTVAVVGVVILIRGMDEPSTAAKKKEENT